MQYKLKRIAKNKNIIRLDTVRCTDSILFQQSGQERDRPGTSARADRPARQRLPSRRVWGQSLRGQWVHPPRRQRDRSTRQQHAGTCIPRGT